MVSTIILMSYVFTQDVFGLLEMSSFSNQLSTTPIITSVPISSNDFKTVI